MGTEAVNGSDHRLLVYRVDRVEEEQAEVRLAIKSIDASLQVLADVQRRLNSMNDAEARLRAIENELPTLKLARKWVLAAMTSGGAVVGAAVLALVMNGARP
ncbi:MAG: hypothetical protein ACREU9_00125 [Gammaproteobacteria bacterium]